MPRGKAFAKPYGDRGFPFAEYGNEVGWGRMRN